MSQQKICEKGYT